MNHPVFFSKLLIKLFSAFNRLGWPVVAVSAEMVKIIVSWMTYALPVAFIVSSGKSSEQRIRGISFKLKDDLSNFQPPTLYKICAA